MKILMLISLLTIIGCQSQNKLERSPNNYKSFFKKEAANQFLRLGEKMLKDKEPTQEEWDNFFNNESMQVIFENAIITQMNRPMYQQYFRIVFLPSKKDSLILMQENAINKKP